MAAPKTQLDFVGFANNERVCAWRLHVDQAVGRYHDQYTLIQLVEVKTNQLVGTFRESPRIRRLDERGRLVPMAQSALVSLHEDFRTARPTLQWRAAMRQAHFFFKRVDFKGTLVRVLPDKGAPLSVDPGKNRLTVTGHPQDPVGFTPMVRMYDGSLMPLGHYSYDDDGTAPLRAELFVYHSHAGRRVAVLSRFTHADGNQGEVIQTQAALFATPDDNPVGSTNTGSLEMIEQNSRSMESLYKSMHPAGKKDYDTYVGRWF